MSAESLTEKEMAILPIVKLVPNPLIRFPRNKPCICGEGKKFKRCHLKDLQTMVPQELADSANVLIGKLKAKGMI